jgi:hypothetical protein
MVHPPGLVLALFATKNPTRSTAIAAAITSNAVDERYGSGSNSSIAATQAFEGRFVGLKTCWSGGRDSNSRSPGPKPEAKAYRIRLDLSAASTFARKSLNSKDGSRFLLDGNLMERTGLNHLVGKLLTTKPHDR